MDGTRAAYKIYANNIYTEISELPDSDVNNNTISAIKTGNDGGIGSSTYNVNVLITTGFIYN